MCLLLALSFLTGCNVSGVVDDSTGASQSPTAAKTDLTIPAPETGGNTIWFTASDGYFYRQTSTGWQRTYIQGVDMGLTEPTTSLDDTVLSYDTYFQWFTQIKAMNANTVRVFSEMPPDFYKALYVFNLDRADDPLYFMQGIWFNEDYMYDPGDAFDDNGDVIDSFERACSETVDIVHGKSSISYGSVRNAVYDVDVSQYLVGYILGLEWDYDFVMKTNSSHADKTSFSGTYLRTAEGASPFEVFLATVGDKLITYETSGYGAQTPVSFLNWQTTDVLKHTNEPFTEEDEVSVDTRNIVSASGYHAGQFAALDVYPYYPEFMNHQPEYLAYLDSNGDSDPYRAYLDDLVNAYDVPVVIAEYGLSTSRGKAHDSVMGMSQGGLNETQQGEYVAKMSGDIADSGCAGGLIFEWQDEWFKQTWNTVKYGAQDPTSRTPNVMSAEQGYGILNYLAGEESVCTVDGSASEWTDADVVSSSGGYTLSAKADPAYLYLCVQTADGFDYYNDSLYVPISTVGRGSTSDTDKGLTFSSAADYLLVINGDSATRVLTDVYNDVFYYNYSVKKSVFPRDTTREAQGSGKYTAINTFTSNQIVLPLTGETIDPTYYESGLLKTGVADTTSPSYDPQADFCRGGNVIELRIAWYLLGVLNVTERAAINDFWTAGEVASDSFKGVKAGLGGGALGTTIALKGVDLSGSDNVTYRSRLKASYDILKSALGGIAQRMN